MTIKSGHLQRRTQVESGSKVPVRRQPLTPGLTHGVCNALDVMQTNLEQSCAIVKSLVNGLHR
jgi:hypothetical protein